MGTKRFLLPVIILLTVFSFNISFAQDAKLDEAFRNLAKNTWKNSEELSSIHNDLISTARAENTSKNYRQAAMILDSADDISTAVTLMQYEFFILVTKPFIQDDKIKPYCQHIFHTLEYTMTELKSLDEHFEGIYGLLDNKAALASAEKAKTIIKDTLNEIQSAMTFLDKTIKSMS